MKFPVSILLAICLLATGGPLLAQDAPPAPPTLAPATDPIPETTAPAPATLPSPAPDAPPANTDIPDGTLPPPELPEPPHKAWHVDYQAARKEAIDQGKHLLLLFTGSDWIPLCRIFDRDILNQPDFVDAATEKYVLVRFDFPKEQRLPAPVAAQNQMFMRAYRVSAFPTVFLTDTDGRPYGINGYQAVTPANYGKIITAMRQMGTLRDQYFEKAENAEGVEKAKLLVKGVPNLPGNLSARYYRPQLETIVANDPQDETGKVEKCKRLIADVDYADQMQKLEQQIEWSKMLDLTDAYIRENNLQGSERQQAMFNKIGVLQKQGNLPDVVRTLMEIVKVDEKTPQGQRAQAALDQLRARKLEEDLSPR
ncbi:MAG: thioredoxin family protein [Verrucomicrobiae bacterium]|nr:thioredoxin family protein [Verrucomicrobiae bacterium]